MSEEKAYEVEIDAEIDKKNSGNTEVLLNEILKVLKAIRDKP